MQYPGDPYTSESSVPFAGGYTITEYLMFKGFQLGRLELTIFTAQLVATGKNRSPANGTLNPITHSGCTLGYRLHGYPMLSGLSVSCKTCLWGSSSPKIELFNDIHGDSGATLYQTVSRTSLQPTVGFTGTNGTGTPSNTQNNTK